MIKEIKKLNKIIWIYLAIYGALFISISFIIISLASLTLEFTNRMHCKMMSDNGHTIKIESFPFLFWDFKHCYIQIDNDLYIPYRKYTFLEEAE